MPINKHIPCRSKGQEKEQCESHSHWRQRCISPCLHMREAFEDLMDAGASAASSHAFQFSPGTLPMFLLSNVLPLPLVQDVPPLPLIQCCSLFAVGKSKEYLVEYLRPVFSNNNELREILERTSQFNISSLGWQHIYRMQNAQDFLTVIGGWVSHVSTKSAHKLELLVSILIMSRSNNVSTYCSFVSAII